MRIRKIFLIMLFIGFVFTLFGCSKDNKDKEETYYVGAIVTEFIFEGKKYVETNEYDEKNEFNCLFGYLINAEDLEKWQNYDRDDSLIYVIVSHNGLYNKKDDSGRLANRFEIYSMEGKTDALAVVAYKKIIYRNWEVENND
ncbi:MAG: hypothetical protein K2O22_00595 [Anaeroplasmataceae bacterium]|nr:hypothetical protein [Anaeroplasmataceae bacterium]